MKTDFSIAFADRLKTAALAKRSRLDQMRARPAQTDPLHDERQAMRQSELAAARSERLALRAERKQAQADALANAADAELALREAALTQKRGALKARKALSAAEAKARRDAKYAARKARV